MKQKDLIKLDSESKKTLEEFILKRIEEIIFDERERPSGLQKVKGGLLIKNQSGKLLNKLKANKGFMKYSTKGYHFDLKMVPYFKYLDDQRRDELNWYLTEAIFEDEKISQKIAELTAKGVKAKFLQIISEQT